MSTWEAHLGQLDRRSLPALLIFPVSLASLPIFRLVLLHAALVCLEVTDAILAPLLGALAASPVAAAVAVAAAAAAAAFTPAAASVPLTKQLRQPGAVEAQHGSESQATRGLACRTGHAPWDASASS